MGSERDRDVGTDAETQVVGLLGTQIAKHMGRRGPQVDDDLGRGHWKILASPHVERHASPAPRVDLQVHGRERLHLRIGCDTLLLAVAAELPADDILRPQRTDGLQHLHLLVAQRLAT